jgi:hypothetical protein
MEGATNKSEYDLNSAITFLLVGLGIGSVLSIILNPKQRVAPEEIKRWRTSGLQPQKDAEKRVA